MNKHLPIQMERAVCPICNEIHEHGGIIMGTTFLSKEVAEEREKLMKNATHFANCLTCKSNLDKGYYAIIAIDERLSSDKIPFRTGIMIWLKDSAVTKVFSEHTLLLLIAQGYAYADSAGIAVLTAMQADGEVPEEGESKICNLCKSIISPKDSGRCDRYNDARCAWHIKN